MKRFGLIIPTCNHAEYVRQLIPRLSELDQDSAKILWVDRGSTDDTVDVVRSGGLGETLQVEREATIGHALNSGVKLAGTDLLVFLQPDVILPSSDWLSKLEEAFKIHSADVVNTGMVYPDRLSPIESGISYDGLGDWTYIQAWSPPPRESDKIMASEACFAAKKSLWRQIGGFDEILRENLVFMDFLLRCRNIRIATDTRDPFVYYSVDNVRKMKAQEADRAYFEAKHSAFLNRKAGKLVSIVILTHNSLDYTKRCVESIHRNTLVPHEIIFVDNGSTDGTVQYLNEIARTHSDCRLILNKENLGYAAGNNQGIQAAAGQYVLLLNNDVVVTPGWLDQLLQCAEREPSIGIVGPVTNKISGAQQVEQVSYDTASLDDLDQFAGEWARRHAGKVEPSWRVVGFCMLIKRAVIEKIGGLDTRYGLGNFEDDDFCIRAAIVGFNAVIAGDCFVHHFGSATFSAEGYSYEDRSLRNWEIFKRKWGLPANLEYAGAFDLSRLLAINSDSHILHCPLVEEADEKELGTQAFHEKRWKEAIGHLEKALTANPTDAGVMNLLALAYDATGEHKASRSILKRAIQAAPDYPGSYYALAALFRRDGQIIEAADNGCRAVELDPSNADAVKMLENIRDALRCVKPASKSVNKKKRKKHGRTQGSSSTQAEIESRLRRIDLILAKASQGQVSEETPYSGKPKISLCMIAKDEERFIEGCLDSVKDIVDEIIVVDTGSMDGTIEIARRYGAIVHTYKWNDNYSEARNEALKYATGDWILVLDADERLDENSKETLLRAVANPTADGYDMLFHNYDSDEPDAGVVVHQCCRLFRNRPEYRFRGRVHETVGPSMTEAGGVGAELDVIVHHHGYQPKVFADRGKKERYLRLLHAELEENPRDLYVLFHLSRSYLAAQDWENALIYCRQAAEVAPAGHAWSPLIFSGMANALCSSGKSEEAVETVERAERLGIRHPEMNFCKGVALLQLSRFEDAISEFRKAMELGRGGKWIGDTDISGCKANYRIAFAYMAMKDYANAVEYANRVLADKPDNADAHKLLARAHYGLGNTNESEKRWLEALRLVADDVEAQEYLAGLYRFEKRWAEALERYASLLESGHEIAGICLSMGVCAESLGDQDAALEHYSRAAELDENCLEAHVSLGKILGAQGKFAEAIQRFARVIEIDPTCAAAYFNAGDVLYALGDYQKSADIYESGLHHDPTHAPGFFCLGNCYFKIGAYEAAIVAYRQALAINPDYKEAENNLAIVEEILGQRKAA